jgi:hypothetical protein
MVARATALAGALTVALGVPQSNAALVNLSGQHFSVQYDNLLWRGTAKGPTNFFFTCASSDCGGPKWACVFNTVPSAPGQPIVDLTNTMIRVMADQAVKSLSSRGATGITPLAPARQMMLGDNIGAFLSVRSKDASGVAMRDISFYASSKTTGTWAICGGPESTADKAAWEVELLIGQLKFKEPR